MNHDETNPKSQPEMHPWIEPELEARVIAWVMGEASPFEIAQLETLLAEKPELAIFKRRMEAVHGLLGEAARPDAAPLQLSAARRAKVLETIGAAETAPAAGQNSAATVAELPSEDARRKRRRLQPWIWAAAACVTLGALLPVLTHKQYKRMPGVAMEERARANDPVIAIAQSQTSAEAAPREGKLELAAFDVTPAARKRGELGDEREVQSAAPTRAANIAPVTAPPVVTFNEAPALRAGRQGGEGGMAGRASARFGGAAGTVVGGQVAQPLGEPVLQKVSAVHGITAEVKRRGLGDTLLGIDRPAESAAPMGNVSFDAYNQLNRTVPEQPPREPSFGFAPPPAAPLPGSIVAVEPFTVSADKDLGYAGATTIAGARLNTALLDQATGMTVVTKEQLTDTAALALTDSFGKKADRAADVSRLERDDRPAARPAQPAPAIAETNSTTEPVSTFSLHVSDVSFRLAHAALTRGELPEAARIRPEEFYNAFDYGDPSPAMAEKVGARIEQSAHPVLQQRNLVRLALKVPATGRAASQPLVLTVLLDTSGSMEREDRVATVRRALAELVALLGPEDRVTLVGFARQPRLLADNVRGNQAGMLVDLVARTPSEGGTNLEEALNLAGQLASRHRSAAAQNRIVLLTDGAANLGNANPAQLATAIETLRQQGIAFDACGIGLNGLDDGMLESLTRRGDGRYYVLDSAASADAGFARQLAGAFRPAAENVKVQVRFNPARVGRYRLIGFDQHRLREQDFRNDAVDAAELAAEEAAVALYEVEPLPQGSGEVGELFVRFRDPATGQMVERSWTIAYEPQARSFDRATPSLQLAGTSALLAEKLRQSPIASQFKLADLAATVNALRGHYAHEPRVQELMTMFAQARRLKGE